jgi:uncharacterized protein
LTLAGSGLVGLRVKILQNQKDKTDEYIKLAIGCLGTEGNDLDGITRQQKNLDEIFEQAVAALIGEEISQESFRTFNEVYKDVREALERKISTTT